MNSPSRTRTYNLAVNRQGSGLAEKPGSPLFAASYQPRANSQTSASCRVFSRSDAVSAAQNGSQNRSPSPRQVVVDPFMDWSRTSRRQRSGHLGDPISLKNSALDHGDKPLPMSRRLFPTIATYWMGWRLVPIRCW